MPNNRKAAPHATGNAANFDNSQINSTIDFTKYSSPEPLSKRYWVEDSKVHKKAAAQMSKGHAERLTMTFLEFEQALNKADSNTAFGYGVHPLSLTDKVKIACKGKEQPDKNIISRSQDYFKYSYGAGILMFDHDPSAYGQTFAPDGLLAALVGIHPAIAKAARIVRGSVSAGVHLTGEQPKEGKGLHLYLPVTNASDIPRYGKLLFDRLWLSGHGYVALSASGATLLRAPIDAAVFSPERLDFVGTPIISGAGLQFTPPAIIYTDGGYLDTKSLPDLTDEESAEVARLQSEAKAAIRPRSKAKQDGWASDKIKAMVATGIEPGQAQVTINRILKGGCQDLYEDFLLEFPTGMVSVADVLKNPKAYDSKALADPIEGAGYGATTAKFYFNSGKPVINSLAHGQETSYFLHSGDGMPIATFQGKSDDWGAELLAHVDKFNETHASVVIGGKHKVMRVIKGEASHTGRLSYEFFDRKALELLYDNTSIKTGEKEVNGQLKTYYANHLMAWAKHPKCRTFTGGVVFLPGRNAPPTHFNTWRGFTVKPTQNEALLMPIYSHIKDVVCAGVPELNEYFLNWIAYTVQNPDKPAGAAIVARGEKGSGKGTIGHFLKDLWGNHGLHITNAKHLVGNFNGHLNDACFLFADEAFYSGDKQHEGVLKGLITEPTIIIERKGIDGVAQPNYLKVFMATNADFAVPASRDERRYCVLDVSSSRIGDRVYFDALQTACKSDAVKSAFLYAMLNRGLTGFHTGDIPDSVGLRAQRYHSMDSVQKWVVDALVKGSFDIVADTLNHAANSPAWVVEASSDDLNKKYGEWCDGQRTGEYRRETQTKVGTYLGRVFKKGTRNGGRAWYFLGTIDEARTRFEAYEKISLDELQK